MKKTFIILAAAALAAIVSCSKQKEEFNNTEEILTRVSVSLDNTKTSLSGTGSTRKVYWSNGDAININGNASNALTGIGSEESSAEFSFGVVLDTPYNVLYPASDYKSASTITLPSEQAAADGTFADGSMPMYAYSTTNAVASMSHLCGVLEVNLTGSATIAFVQVTGGNSEQMSGDFTIDYETGALTATSTATADLKVKTLVNKTLTSTATPVYVVVPAGTYSSGLTLRIVDDEGNYMDKTISGSRTVTAGHLAKLPSLAFASNGTLITTAAQWNAFAAEVNGGNTTLDAEVAADIVFDATTNAAFASVGSETSPYEGTLEGGAYTISGLDVSAPLFGAISGTVQNLTVDGTFTVPAGVENFGTVAGYVSSEGTLTSVTSTAALSAELASGDEINLGGLVGKNEGLIYTSFYKSATEMSVKLSFTTARVGGLVGYNTSTGKVQRSENATDIRQNTYYPDNLSLGGVIGVSAASGYNSTDNTLNMTVRIKNTGKIYTGKSKELVSKSKAIHSIGGVIGEQTAEYVATTFNYLDNEGAMQCYVSCNNFTTMAYGGIFGKTSEAVNGTNNQFAIYNNAAVEVIVNDTIEDLVYEAIAVGGLVGSHESASNFQNAKNNGNVSVHGVAESESDAKAIHQAYNKSLTTYRIIYTGGVVGELGVTKAKINRCTNNGTVSVSFPYQSSTTATGGILGGAILKNHTVVNCTSNGNINADIVTFNANKGFASGVGGIIGKYWTGNYFKTNTVGAITITVNGSASSGTFRNFGSQIGYSKSTVTEKDGDSISTENNPVHASCVIVFNGTSYSGTLNLENKTASDLTNE